MARRSTRASLYLWMIPLLLVFALSACSGRDAIEMIPMPTATVEADATPSPAGEPDDPDIAGPTEEEMPLLQLHIFNGQPPQADFATQGPYFSLYRDGRVITPAGYDYSTSIRPLQVTLLSEAGVQAILDEAQSNGLLDTQSFTNAPWVDDPYILLISHLGDEPVSVSAHALGFVPDSDPEETALSERLTTFSDKLFSLASWLPAGSILEEGMPFQIERLQLATYLLSPESPADTLMPWPLETPLSELGEPGLLGMPCFILEGEALQTVLAAFEEADDLGYIPPLWESDGMHYVAYPRVLPPGDTGCYVVGDNEPIVIYPDDDTIGHGILPGNVLLSISVQGAMTPEEQLHAFPLVTLLGDGSIVTPPPQSEENLLLRTPQITRISEAGIQILLHEAQAAGLLDGDRRFSMVDPALPTTIFQIFPDEQRRGTVIVPGLEDEASSGNLSAEEAEARAKLRAFFELATDIVNHLPSEDIIATDERYAAQLFQWVTQPAELSNLPDDAGPVRQLSWNFEVPIEEFGDPYSLPSSLCATVGTEVLDQVEGASANTRWESDGYVFVLHMRPLLPHERPCQRGDEIACVPSPAAAVTPAPDHIEHGADADDLVLRIDSFYPHPYGLGGRPAAALYGDGSLVTPGMVPAIDPGPAMGPLVTSRMTEEGIQAILRQTHLLGLLGADAEWHGSGDPDERMTLTILAGGETTFISISNGPCTISMSDAEINARAAFSTFFRQFSGITYDDGQSLDWFPEDAITSRDEPYVVKRIQIVVAPFEESGDGFSSDIWPEIEWPLETPLAAFGDPVGSAGTRCGVVTGAELDLILPLIQQANDMTPWLSDGALYRMWPRPLLPDEAGCDVAGR